MTKLSQPQRRPARIGITLGDPAGIGPEIVVKALLELEPERAWTPVLFGNPHVLQAALDLVGASRRVKVLDDVAAVDDDPRVLSLVATAADPEPVPYGVVGSRGGEEAGRAIMAVVDAAKSGAVDVINTAPLNKEALRLAGYHYPGHTEMLAERFGVDGVYTMFEVDTLRIFFLTRHHPLSEVPALLGVAQVHAGITRCLGFLKDLGVETPVLAVAALNPHGGEHGLLGTEERAILEPAIKQAQSEGHRVEGPIPADAVFYQARMGRYAGVLSLYHDQGHIAAKTLDFYGTVSVTLGLPVLRTSVDHGTAFDIAGRGVANAHGQVAALSAAGAWGARARWSTKQPKER
ncbi:MAG: 4-hydroxythreonine-4-phosphate dehydrogenase PdxA [Thermaerobacter sp.]|nr:4-hydroxythreonine-4-phosphate dehydrogenase PdxA [Thermaerobacter sp.]MDA8205958.1 4-hydroxythreonine-4-phosphate dehydrogenase PdxA [Thermaerobacter sp.]